MLGQRLPARGAAAAQPDPRLFAYRFIPDLEMVERHTQEHLQILDLLEPGDREQAATLMRAHLHWSGGGDQIS